MNLRQPGHGDEENGRMRKIIPQTDPVSLRRKGTTADFSDTFQSYSSNEAASAL